MSTAVSALYVYPLKSCRAVHADAVLITSLGPSCDRRWMIVREADGKVVTQRQVPKLCLVEVTIPQEALLGRWDALAPDAALVVKAPGQATDLRVPLVPPPGQALRTVTVWEFTGAAVDEGDAAAAWLSEFTGLPVRLVRYAGAGGVPAAQPAAPPAPTPQAEGPALVRYADAEFADAGAEVAFADCFQVLVARAENLAALNAELAENDGAGGGDGGGGGVPMARFRPNIVVEGGGGGAWEDDAWRRLRVTTPGAKEGIDLRYIRPCDRCKVPTIDQDTATEGREPLATLNRIRSGAVLGWNKDRRSWTHSVFFCWNAVAAAGGGVVRVGDTVDVVERAAWA